MTLSCLTRALTIVAAIDSGSALTTNQQEARAKGRTYRIQEQPWASGGGKNIGANADESNASGSGWETDIVPHLRTKDQTMRVAEKRKWASTWRMTWEPSDTSLGLRESHISDLCQPTSTSSFCDLFDIPKTRIPRERVLGFRWLVGLFF